MATDTILETRGLTKEFKGFVAVNGVNLAIARGTIHALIGPNGAGKTTCFNLLTHFLTPTRGQIFFKGNEITGQRPAAIARMGLVRSFQISAVFSHLSVLENVRIALQRKRGHSLDFWRSERVLHEHDARARELIDAVGLGSFEQSTDFATASIDTAINNQQAAMSSLQDTDLASTSTQLSQASLQQNAAIALQAQGNQLLPSLLDLLG